MRRIVLMLFAVAGGILSAQLGSGSDTASFVFTVLVWNSFSPQHDQIDLAVATASSVVIMGRFRVRSKSGTGSGSSGSGGSG